MKSRLEGFKKFISWVAGFLSLARYLPIPGEWRGIALAVAAVLTGLAGTLDRCSVSQPPSQTIPTPPTSTPTPIQIHTPSPTPTPRPTPLIIVPEHIVAREIFVVRVTAPFTYSTHLLVGGTEVCTFGKEYRTNYYRCNVILYSSGKRLLSVKLPSGNVEAWINVEAAGQRAH